MDEGVEADVRPSHWVEIELAGGSRRRAGLQLKRRSFQRRSAALKAVADKKRRITVKTWDKRSNAFSVRNVNAFSSNVAPVALKIISAFNPSYMLRQKHRFQHHLVSPTRSLIELYRHSCSRQQTTVLLRLLYIYASLKQK